jgi:uncharacterized protein (TIGR02996 family)
MEMKLWRASAVGERGHSQFKNGGLCNYPHAAMAAGYKVRYVRSTYRVEVGAVWLRRRLERCGAIVEHPHAAGFGAAILEAPRDRTPLLIYADWLEENGYGRIAARLRASQRDGAAEESAPARESC